MVLPTTFSESWPYTQPSFSCWPCTKPSESLALCTTFSKLLALQTTFSELLALCTTCTQLSELLALRTTFWVTGSMQKPSLSCWPCTQPSQSCLLQHVERSIGVILSPWTNQPPNYIQWNNLRIWLLLFSLSVPLCSLYVSLLLFVIADFYCIHVLKINSTVLWRYLKWLIYLAFTPLGVLSIK